MNLLRERYIGPYSRKFLANRTTIRLQISKNLYSTFLPVVTIPQAQQAPESGIGGDCAGADIASSRPMSLLPS